MSRQPALRTATPIVAAVAVYACNVYTEDLLFDPADFRPHTGGMETGGVDESGGWTGGRSASGGLGGAGTGGELEAPGGAAAAAGVLATGGDALTGGSGGTGGEETGGTTGGAVPGGAGGEGGTAGGASGAGSGSGGHATGGVPTGGYAAGGATTGGASSGGAPTGGAPTGGAPTGGIGTGGLPPGFTAIDMLDVVNNTIELEDGQGLWYVFHDGSTDGVITPDTPRTTDDLIPEALPAPRDESLLGVHVVANALFTSWGAGVGFNLNSPDEDTRLKYDVSPYTGIVFWGRTGTGSVTVRVKLVTADIAPETEPGGECVADCSDAFGQEIDLTTAWKEYSVPFSELTQQQWGYAPPGGFDTTGVLAVQLHANAGVAFDIWLDDVRFYE